MEMYANIVVGGSNWEVKVFLLQVTYSIIFHLIPASLICCALWPPSGTVWFASRKWIMVRWLEPRAPLNSGQTSATPCSTHMQILVVEVCDLMWFFDIFVWSIEISYPWQLWWIDQWWSEFSDEFSNLMVVLTMTIQRSYLRSIKKNEKGD